MHVFAYGTLIFPEVWQAVVGQMFPSVEAQAFGFRRHRIRDADYPGITPSVDASSVKGVVYLDVDQEAIHTLDEFEGEFYLRERVPVNCADGKLREAEAYVIPEIRRNLLTEESWDPDQFVAQGGLRRFTEHYPGFERIKRV